MRVESSASAGRVLASPLDEALLSAGRVLGIPASRVTRAPRIASADSHEWSAPTGDEIG